MMAMRFESKRDAWLVWMMRGIPAGVLLIIGYAWYTSHHDLRGPIIGAFILLFAEIFLFEMIFRSTYYVIEGPTLVIRSSGIAWRVPIAEIRSITPTRSAFSSPALSLDRLRIEYGGRRILVSPEDRHKFIAALRSVNPSIVA
jgi:Bacterial PH domain